MNRRATLIPSPFARGIGTHALALALSCAVTPSGLAQSDVAGAIASGGRTDSVTVFRARKIITMERSNPTATAVAIRGDRIVAVGSLDDVTKALGNSPRRIDGTFADKVVMPGFIEQHLHPLLALTLAVEVIAPEDWEVPGKVFKAARSSAEYLARLKSAAAAMRDPNEILFTWGYHQYFHGKVTRRELDAISRTRPIVVWHRSVHEMILNTPALKGLGITRESVTGHGAASEQSDWDKGHFFERGLELVAGKVMPALGSPARMALALKQMAAILHQNGVTAINEPGALVTPELLQVYRAVLGAEDVPFYTFLIADGRAHYSKLGAGGALAETERTITLAPRGKVSFFEKQVKLLADGAIVSQLMQMTDGYTDGHKGEWIMTPEDLDAASRVYWDAGYQLHIHANGDAGLGTVLDILEKRMRENPRPDHRTVIVHFANSTEDQVRRIARLGAVVSANPYYVTGFADKFAQVGLGPERADAMVRLGSVEKAGVSFSLHSDLPMGPADPLYLAWCAVNRITQSGRAARPDLGVTVDGAMRAITVDAAYSWRKEHELGSIAPGKIANLTILEQDPYAVDPKTLKDIPVWGTVFEGRKFPVER